MKKPLKPSKHSLYRRVEIRIWDDLKFKLLSKSKPSAQWLWIYLLTGPHTGQIPGIARVGLAALAEELGWKVKDVEKCFKEIEDLGMAKADWKNKVIWIPNAISCNKPNPNIITSWEKTWDLIPECLLKLEAYEEYKAHVYSYGDAFAKAFDNAICKPSLNPIANGLVKASPNQEQEQEQEQERDQERERDQDQVQEDQDLISSLWSDSVDSNYVVKRGGQLRLTWLELDLVELPKQWLEKVIAKYPQASEALALAKFSALREFFINTRPYVKKADWYLIFESWIGDALIAPRFGITSSLQGTPLSVMVDEWTKPFVEALIAIQHKHPEVTKDTLEKLAAQSGNELAVILEQFEHYYTQFKS